MYSEPAGFSVSFNLDGILLVEAFQIIYVLRWIVAAFGRHTASALANLLDYGVGCRHDLLFTSQQLEWRDQARNMKPEEGVYPTNTSEFVGVCEVLAVPREQVIDAVDCRDSHVQRVSLGSHGDSAVGDQLRGEFLDLFIDGQLRDSRQGFEAAAVGSRPLLTLPLPQAPE